MTRGKVLINKNILGRGIYYYANGDIFLGEWVEDKFHGNGNYLFANGNYINHLQVKDILVY